MDCRFLTILVLSILPCSQANGFCGSRKIHSSLVRSAVRAAEWLRNNHDGNGTYHEGHVSAFVFHSLRMIGHSVDKGADHMNAEITTRGLGSIPGGRVALYVHGAIAACRDPKRFYNFNLIRALTTKLKKFPKPGFGDYFKYSLAVLALCSSGHNALPYVDKIIERISSRKIDEYVDTLTYEIMALSCVRSRGGRKAVEKVQNSIREGSQELLRRKGNESHIDNNEVSTALVSQALLAANVNKWKSCKTLKWLQSRQNPDGSFSSLMATAYLIPSLVGALPYEVRDIPCHRTDLQQPREEIEVCLEVQFELNKYTTGNTPPPSMCVTVPNGTNTHDILKLAAKQHQEFTFTTQKTGYGHMLLSICGIARSHEHKLYWSMYIDGRSPLVGIDDLRPSNGTTIVFKYRKINWGI